MSTPAGLLSDLATVLLVLRDNPDSKEDHKGAFRRVIGSLGVGDHSLKVTGAGFQLDQVEVPIGRGEAAALWDHLRGHGVGEIRFPVGVMTSTLLSFFRVMAAPVGSYGSFDHLMARVDSAGAGIIQVFPLPEQLSTATFASPLIPDPATRQAKKDDDGRLAAIGPDALSEAKVGMMHFVTMEMQTMGTGIDELVKQMGSVPDAQASDLLNQLVTSGEMAGKRGEWGDLLKAAFGLIELERQGGKEGGQRSYSIALRRLLPRSVLERLAKFTASGGLKTEAIAVFNRMGADGTEVLLQNLANAEDANLRRGYLAALKEMTEGGTLLIHMLSHDQWFVVRNVADLCGELHLERSVSGLTRQMNHSDERVRRAVAGALAKIGGPASTEPLRRALKDPSASVRLQVAQDLDARKAKGLAMSLAVAAEEEDKGDVQRQMYLALGRIGSPEAIQALAKAAEPGGKVFKRKPLASRLAAVEGLHLAGPSAAGALKSLMTDENREVREAVEKALSTLWE